MCTGEGTVLKGNVQDGDTLGPTERDPTLLDEFDPDGKDALTQYKKISAACTTNYTCTVIQVLMILSTISTSHFFCHTSMSSTMR